MSVCQHSGGEFCRCDNLTCHYRIVHVRTANTRVFKITKEKYILFACDFKIRQVTFKLTSVSINFAFKITLQVNVSPVSDVNHMKAKYLNSRLVTCKFPEKNFYAVAVRNGGIRVSDTSSTLSTTAIVTIATTPCVLHGSNVKLEYAVKDMSSLLISMYEFRYVSLDKQCVPYILSFFSKRHLQNERKLF